ncbi:DUF2461 domain-containing protein [Paracraurococcus lichenis]|uniref:DUF2461 domain-containing protein n=1 Tax=Paracraurococcus lichenis TaxID=3064888 RepID=A0ABT9E3K8_9PROT|nr:DUF2461 domain-containing protein [Paracraurococcus sp. LOR1-02]MDO9710746.1 DUF2461 domain-containing protein [Paracraurococcus sp. LOR1-02]
MRGAAAEMVPPPPPFAGFAPAAFAFLRDLAREQTREWFQANRDIHEAEVREPMASLVAAVAEALARRRIPLRGDPQRAIFRIHRDVRFSRDKQPYKTHCGATLTRDGGRLSPGLLYIHIDPLGCFTAAGFWRPEPRALDAIRHAIADRPAAFRRMLAALAAKGLALSPDEEALKRPPRGYEAVEEPVLREALRCRSLTVRRALPEAAVVRADLPEVIAEFAVDALPLLKFGWGAIDA